MHIFLLPMPFYAFFAFIMFQGIRRAFIPGEALLEAFWRTKCKESKFTQTPNQDRMLLNIGQAPGELCRLCIGHATLMVFCDFSELCEKILKCENLESCMMVYQ